MDLPLYTSVSRSSISDLGRSAYQTFDKAVVLTQVMRQSGQDQEQVRFREILLRLRDASVTKDDWETTREGQIANKDNFSQALHLLPTVDAVAAYNLDKLRHNGQPVAETKAIHSGPRASTAASDDAGGLDPVVHIAQGANIKFVGTYRLSEWSNGYSAGDLLPIWRTSKPSYSCHGKL